jgi:hypothetical protein
VTDQDLKDGRIIPDPVRGTDPSDLAKRARRWWNFGGVLDACRRTQRYPTALLAAFGSPSTRIVIGSWQLRRGHHAWEDASYPGEEAPLSDPTRGDFKRIVGRRLAHAYFGQGNNAFCLIHRGVAYGPAPRVRNLEEIGRRRRTRRS